ncbi:hypothetical protein BN1723_012730 [Verticillium longisporum]|uniref:Uncharacterized protein n=1 Tax=Verticillium longisporum TaxID=100787 RepID=A0A0G4LL09_VERLO|nr:hypothetical protein BN1723_012730 [Verticillium longisporum]
MSRCPVSGCYLDCAGRNVMPQRDEPVSLYFPTVSQVRQGHTGRGLGGLVNNTTRPRWFALLCFRSCRRAIMMFRNFMQLNFVILSCRSGLGFLPPGHASATTGNPRCSSWKAAQGGKTMVWCIGPNIDFSPEDELNAPAPSLYEKSKLPRQSFAFLDESRHRFGQDTAAVITSFELSTMMKSSSPVRVSKKNVRPASHPNVKHCASRTAFVACQFPSNRRSIIARHNGRGTVF